MVIPTMADVTNIEWTDHTFNPWWGCSRVSPACRFCYADRDAKRYGHDVWRRKGPRRMLSDANWTRPLKWNRDAERAGVRARVFCASMADVFEDHPQVVEPRARLWPLIEQTPWLDWQLLTKRPENVAGMAPWGSTWPDNVWLGTSVESQEWADKRIPMLQEISARVRFLSCEPLVGHVDLKDHLFPTPCSSGCGCRLPSDPDARECGCDGDCCMHPDWPFDSGIHWVIAGGESGPKARPMHPWWVDDLKHQCSSWGVPFLFKQWGEWRPANVFDVDAHRVRFVGHDGRFCPVTDRANHPAAMARVGKRNAGRELDGRTWDEFPEVAS